MIRHMCDAVADMKRDIDRWEKEQKAAETADQAHLADQIRRWIVEGKKIIDNSGF